MSSIGAHESLLSSSTLNTFDAAQKAEGLKTPKSGDRISQFAEADSARATVSL
jgi:hypothetical protein